MSDDGGIRIWMNWRKKSTCIASCKLWKDAGKPRSGSIFTIYRRDKALYKNNIRTRQGKEREYFTNDL